MAYQVEERYLRRGDLATGCDAVPRRTIAYMSGPNTRRWINLVRALPKDVQMDETLLGYIRDDRPDEIVAFLRAKVEESEQEVRDFRATHKHLASIDRRMRDQHERYVESEEEEEDPPIEETLSDLERTEVDWFAEEMWARKDNVRLWRSVLQAAREIAGQLVAREEDEDEV